MNSFALAPSPLPPIHLARRRRGLTSPPSRAPQSRVMRADASRLPAAAQGIVYEIEEFPRGGLDRTELAIKVRYHSELLPSEGKLSPSDHLERTAHARRHGARGGVNCRAALRRVNCHLLEGELLPFEGELPPSDGKPSHLE